MPGATSPKVSSVQVVPVQPEPADEARIAFLRADRNLPLEDVLYLVKVYLEEELPVEGEGYALYVGDEWIQKYSDFNGGIFFNVYDPRFVEEHAGQTIRFTQDHESFVETGVQLPAFSSPEPATFQLRAMNAAEGVELPLKRNALQH
jgi:hypothetical protein